MKDYNKLSVAEMPQEYQDRIKRFDGLFIKATGKPFTEDSLFDYELGCMQQSLAFVDHFKDITNQELEEWCKDRSLLDIADKARRGGCYIQNGHSGNSLAMSVRLFLCYRQTSQLLKYVHGCLTPLMGDEGYHDDRSDVPSTK